MAVKLKKNDKQSRINKNYTHLQLTQKRKKKATSSQTAEVKMCQRFFEAGNPTPTLSLFGFQVDAAQRHGRLLGPSEDGQGGWSHEGPQRPINGGEKKKKIVAVDVFLICLGLVLDLFVVLFEDFFNLENIF